MADRICIVDGCDDIVGPKSARGMCAKHYRRWMKRGTTDLPSPADRECSIEGCERPRHAHGWCQLHHKRWWTHGNTDPTTRFPPALERLAAGLVEQSNGCIEWTGSTTAGYGKLHVDGKQVYTHRLVWELANGPIPDGMVVRHFICDNPPCCNVEHLALGTDAENVADRIAKGRGKTNGYEKRTHCRKGHPFDEANTHVDSHGHRQCIACRREKDRIHYWKERNRLP